MHEEEREKDSGDSIERVMGLPVDAKKKKKKRINEPMKTISSQSHRNFWQEMSGGLMPVARLLAIVTTSKP